MGAAGEPARGRRGGTALNAAGAAAVLALGLAWAPAQAQGVQGDPAAAQAKISMCVGCHEIGGYKTAFPTVYHVPKIVGQSSAYIASALKAYRSGERSHPSMRAIAGSLSDQDIADLAAFYSGARQN